MSRESVTRISIPRTPPDRTWLGLRSATLVGIAAIIGALAVVGAGRLAWRRRRAR